MYLKNEVCDFIIKELWITRRGRGDEFRIEVFLFSIKDGHMLKDTKNNHYSKVIVLTGTDYQVKIDDVPSRRRT